MSATLTEIINEASTEVIKNAPAIPEVPVTETKVIEPKEDAAAKDEPKDDWTPEELLNAKNIWKSLKAGGEEAAFIIDTLASRNGYSKIETKAEAKEAKIEIKNELVEALGEDYPDLVTKLGPAIDKYVARKLEEGTAELRGAITASEQEKLEARSDDTFKKISTDFYEGKEVPSEVDSEMAKLMGKYKPEAGQGIEEYVMDIFHLATAKLGRVPPNGTSRKAAEVAKKNAPAALDTSKGRPTPASEVSLRDQGKKMNLNDSIAAAIAEVNQRMEKK